MNPIDLTKSRIAREVERRFAETPPRPCGYGFNPVTCEEYLIEGDAVEQQKELARNALMARVQFDLVRPPDAPRLPLGYVERERLKETKGLFGNLLSWYARSLESRHYIIAQHPPFDDYVRGVLALGEQDELVTFHSFSPGDIAQQEKRFSPRPLAGIGPALIWQPPEFHAKTMASYRGSLARVRAAS
jgi:hypothetical protein